VSDVVKNAAPRGLLAAPSFPVAIALAAAPTVAVLQSKAMAPLALVAMLLAVIAHGRRHRALPWPRSGAALAAIALGAWGMVSALWAIEPLRALEMGATVVAMVLLGGAAAQAVAQDEAEARRFLARAAFAGLVAGLTIAALDDLTGNQVRALVRGLREIPAELAYGLKPAASVLGMLLPLAAAVPGLPRWLRLAVLLGGAAVIVLMPGDSAKIAAIAGVATLALASRCAKLSRIAGLALGALLLLMPLLVGGALSLGGPGERIPPSAMHRLVIWDFSTHRIAERPVLGWGMEASRAVPGGDGQAVPEVLARLGVHSAPWLEAFANPRVAVLPLHPHNGALQIWLELGLIGALLAGGLLAALGMLTARAPHPGAAAGALVAGFVTGMLSFGVWQPWWVAAELLAVVALAGMPRRDHSVVPE